MTDETSQPDPVADLLDILSLEPAGRSTITVQPVADGTPPDEPLDLGSDEVDVYIGRSQPQPHGRVFGGQVLAQCVVAAGRSVEDVDDGDGSRAVHSLHGYFLRPGDSSLPIRFAVERLRDGRSFSARRVHALQHGKVIMSMILSFQEAAGGLDHQSTMPSAPDPERLPTVAEDIGDIDHPVAQHWAHRRAVDLRHVENSIFIRPGGQAAANQNVWMKVREQMPDDPLLHAAALAYSSDYTLLESTLRRHRMAWADPRLRAASLDHAMWFHRPARADDWILYQQESPSASGGRGLGVGKMYAADGTHVATVAQEGMLRVKDEA